jgi:hypothetical protein
MQHEPDVIDVLRLGLRAKRQQKRDDDCVQRPLQHFDPPIAPFAGLSGTVMSRPMLHNDNGIVSEIGRYMAFGVCFVLKTTTILTKDRVGEPL